MLEILAQAQNFSTHKFSRLWITCQAQKTDSFINRLILP